MQKGKLGVIEIIGLIIAVFVIGYAVLSIIGIVLG